MIEVKINLPFSYPGSLDLVRKLLENSGVNSHSIVESKEKEKVYLAVYASTFLQAQRLKELI